MRQLHWEDGQWCHYSLIGRRIVEDRRAKGIPVGGYRGALVEARFGGTLLGGLVGGCGYGRISSG